MDGIETHSPFSVAQNLNSGMTPLAICCGSGLPRCHRLRCRNPRTHSRTSTGECSKSARHEVCNEHDLVVFVFPEMPELYSPQAPTHLPTNAKQTEYCHE